MENGNKKILWLIAIVNILTLILLTGFIVMSWDVITAGKTSQQEDQQQTPASTQQQTPPTGGQIQPPTGGTTGKCGDGVCGAVEKANPNLCPQDCK